MKSYDELLKNGDLFTDEDDRKHILSLPELKREKILHDRFKKINDMRLSSHILKDLRSHETVKEMKPQPKFEECDFVLTRGIVTENIFKPFIGVLKGCFVRTMINKEYTVCKIMAVKNGPPYKLLTKAPQMCSIVFDLDNGHKMYEGVQVNSFSSSGMTADEFETFITDFAIEKLDELRKKHQKVLKEFTRTLTDAELTKTIENKLRDNPKKQTTAERKIEVITKRDEAMQNKDKDAAMVYQRQLEEIEDEDREERRRKLQEENERRRKRARM